MPHAVSHSGDSRKHAPLPLPAAGALYAVNLEARAVQSVAQAHDGALTALAAHAGFCVTGSADGRLRLWGGDLQEAYLEAAHNGAVTGKR